MPYVVVCEDREIRHSGTFPDYKSAAMFADWGHCCTNQHSIVIPAHVRFVSSSAIWEEK